MNYKVLIMTLIVTSCSGKNSISSNQDSVVRSSSKSDSIIQEPEKANRDYSSTNVFAGQPFLIEPTVEMLSNDSKYKMAKKDVINEHDKNVVDEVINFISDSNSFSFYKAKHATFMTDAEVTSPNVKFKNGILVGMEKEQVKNLLEGLVIVDTGKSYLIETLG